MCRRKIIENGQNFCRIFRFLTEISSFSAKIFFHWSTTPIPSFLQKIRFLYWKPDFLSIFIDFGRKWPILADPPYFGAPVLAPL